MKTTTKIVRGNRALAVAAAASILFLTGCNNAEPASTDTAGAPASTSASAPAGVPVGLTQDCTAAVETFRDLVKDMIMTSQGADAKAAARKALTDYATAARAHAGKVSDPALRAAIEKQAAAADRVATAADPTDLDDAAFESASGELEKVCEDALRPTVAPGTPTERIGAAGSACELPISFDLPPLWKPKAVDVDELGELADIFRHGSFEAVCEVDAKPAGEVGFLRVFVSNVRSGTPRARLEAFVAADAPNARKAGNYEVKKIAYTELTVGGQPAAEVTWEPYNKSMDHASKYSAFALKTAKGFVVVQLSPFGADEHENVLPAYELAKRTLTVNG